MTWFHRIEYIAQKRNYTRGFRWTSGFQSWYAAMRSENAKVSIFLPWRQFLVVIMCSAYILVLRPKLEGFQKPGFL